MITEHLIKFTAKKPATPRDGAMFYVRSLRSDFDRFGYFVGSDSSVWRDPHDKRVIWAHWTMTGSDAWKHLWAAQLDPADLDARNHLRGELACDPEVVKLMPSRTHYSCKCSAKTSPALDLWCTPRSMYPPLLCSKGGAIPMYRLHLSPPTLVLLGMWNDLARVISDIGTRFDRSETADFRQFLISQKSETSSYFKITRQTRDAVEKETGRKVNIFDRPYSIVRL